MRQKKFSIKDLFGKCDQIPRIWSHLLKKTLMENFFFADTLPIITARRFELQNSFTWFNSKYKQHWKIKQIFLSHFNPYSPNVTFLYPLKMSENRRFSDVFRVYRNVTLGEYGLSQWCISIPPEKSENQSFFDVFKGYRNGTLG